MGCPRGGHRGTPARNLSGAGRPARRAGHAMRPETPSAAPPAAAFDRRPVFPFTALVGQERMKRALILNTINPRLGGVLIRGAKRTAKSTAVRGLASLLP